MPLYPGRCPGLGAFAPSGRIADCLIPRALPWAKSFCPFRACCLYGLLGLQGDAVMGFWALLLIWASALSGRAAVGYLIFRACCCGLLDLQGVAAYMSFLTFWSCFCELLGHRPYLKPANFKRIIQKKRENDGNLRK